MRRNRKKQSIGMLIILASSIIMVNLLGISYAHWNDNLNLTTSITTGFIFPRYIDDTNNNAEKTKISKAKVREVEAANLAKDTSMGEINARFINENTLEISGWCYPSYSESIAVRFGNDGTIPIVYKGMEAEDEGEIIQQIQFNGSNIDKNNKKMKNKNQDMIDKKDAEELEIHIEAKDGADTEYGNRSFTYLLQFEQGLK